MRIYEISEAEQNVIDRPPVKKKEEVPLHVPGGATVVVLNDPVTPGEVVIEAVMYGTGLSQGEAIKRVMQAHTGGYAAVASYASRDLAESVAQKIEQHARSNKRYDHYRPHIPYMGRAGYNGPWPLTCEVMDADQA